MGKVITFGELLLRLTPQGYNRFVQANNFNITFGGAEANVAVLLANLGLDSAFVTKLPQHEIGQAGINYLRQYGVDTTKIIYGGNRVGVYYLEKGASQRPSKVIYDRQGSSFSYAEVSDFDWDSIFEGVSWFHFTGITLALSDELYPVCLQALKKAKEKGITVSFDLNYRKNLWSIKKAQEVIIKLMPYIDVCIANEEHVQMIFEICSDKIDKQTGELTKEGYKEISEKIIKKFRFKKLAITMRRTISANDNKFSALLYDAKNMYFGKMYDIQIVDRVGGGDSFSGGLIYSLMHNNDLQKSIDFAIASACLKHSIEGDFNLVSIEEIEQLAHGNQFGRVQR